MSSKKHAKRFYDTVSPVPQGEGYGVTLDKRNLRTPGKALLIVPRASWANLIATEWDAQDEFIRPETMPITRLINVALERTASNRDALIQEIRKYAGTDLLCYREDKLRVLAQRQEAQWTPVLDWAASTYGIKLQVQAGIIPASQSDKSLQKVQDYAALKTDIMLTLLAHLTASFGSAILAMAVMEGFVSPARGLELSRLDELYQIELWGQDEEAAERSDNIETEILALARLLEG